MNLIPSKVASLAWRQLLVAQKHSPKAMFVVGIVGFGATVTLACRASLKMNEAIAPMEEAKDATAKALEHPGYSAEDQKRDLKVIKVKTISTVAKLYAPTVIVGALSICALTGSHVVLSSRNVALTSAYAALDKGFKEYRKRVLDDVGEDKEREYRFEHTETTSKDKTGKKITTKELSGVPSVYARFFDEYSSSWNKTPEYNLTFLRCQQNYANDLLRSRGHVFLNEVYDMLGVDRSKAGAVVGWVRGNGDDFIDFGVFDRQRLGARDFVNGREASILLDFNVDGVIYDKI